ncbi:hypothetical protein V8G54_024506 [Vigna mungo]|uniref:GDSL esterase/lipase n=1 Tax=Vigna mungo TaxID=3915 RepID=A0AAQ3N775_VIGMU
MRKVTIKVKTKIKLERQKTHEILFIPKLLLTYIVVIVVEVEGAERLGEVKPFVFGDSYVDTGNLVNSISYKPPSGITFLGTPAGRFSYGCVLTDYIGTSSFLHFCHILLINFRSFFVLMLMWSFLIFYYMLYVHILCATSKISLKMLRTEHMGSYWECGFDS